MGSVKDLIVLEPPTEKTLGKGRFIFSDRYSVFDWGEMPNHLNNKGKSLCLIGAFFFEKLEALGIKTHYLGVLEDGVIKKLDQLKKPVDTMEIKLVRVLEPEIIGSQYIYSVYQSQKGNFLVPLEIIYRNYLPEGSSVFKRLEGGSLKLEELSLDEMPSPGQKLNQPLIDVSTKLESTDRYINWKEAQEIAFLSQKEVKQIKELVIKINELITSEVSRLNLNHEDGKIELAFDENRNLMVVDVLGTPDECRFTFEGVPVSKEAARIFYRQTDWFQEVEEAKKKDRLNWKREVSPPPPLPLELDRLISQLYQAFCNEITDREWFAVSSLQEVLEKLKITLKGSQKI